MKYRKADVERVVRSAGLRIEEAGDSILKLAEKALDRYYYINRAADWLARQLAKTPSQRDP
jgi:3-methyladenine DNA glycosylase AlkD